MKAFNILNLKIKLGIWQLIIKVLESIKGLRLRQSRLMLERLL